MKRFTAIRVFNKAIEDNDIAIFIGDSILHNEALLYDRQNNLYLKDEDYMISFALGITMSTNNRVFIFCEDSYFIRNISELMQAAVSKCKNLFFILLISGEYNSVQNSPNVFESVNSKHGILYNMGFLVHDYTNYFSISNTTKEINSILKNTKGPLSIIVNVDKGIKKMKNISICYKDNLNKLKSFLINNN